MLQNFLGSSVIPVRTKAGAPILSIILATYSIRVVENKFQTCFVMLNV